MNSPVLMLPKRPPSAVSTVTLAGVGLFLSAVSVAVFYTAQTFPSSTPLIQGFSLPSTLGNTVAAILASFTVLVASFALVLSAVINETKRIQHEHVIKEYTRITGDKRYVPYILPRHTRTVLILTILSAVAPTITLVVEVLHLTGAVK